MYEYIGKTPATDDDGNRYDPLTDAEKVARVKAVYDMLDVPHLTEQQIGLRFERALAQLDAVDAPAERIASLRAYAESLMGRQK